jgi:hypothetical protein
MTLRRTWVALVGTALTLASGVPAWSAAPLQRNTSPCPASIAQAAPSKAASLALSQPTQATPRLCKLELTVQTRFEVANPYDPDEIDLRVRFTSPRGETISVPAFYYLHQSDPNASGWRVRFTPVVAGRWRATAEATLPESHYIGAPVSFIVSPRAASGFVRVNPRNPRYLAFDDGHSFFPIGLNLGWWRDDAIKDYTRWLDALQANGATATRIWMAPWSFGLEWNDTGLGNYNNRQLRAHWLDQVIAMAEQRGIYIVLGLIPDRDLRGGEGGLWADNPYNAANGGPLATPQDFVTNAEAKRLFKQRLRYVAARWGYSPNILAWEYWNEVEATRIETPQLKPWIEEMTAALREADPNHHLITTSYIGNGDNAIWAMPEIDLLQRHEYNAWPKWFAPIEDGFRLTQDAPAKPLLFGEFGYASSGEPLNPATKDGIHLHNSLWASAFSGFATTAMYWWWEDYVEAGDLWPQFKGLSGFLKDEDMATLRPAVVSSSTSRAVVLALARDDRALLWLRNAQYDQGEASFKYTLSQSTGQPYQLELDELDDVQIALDGLRNGNYSVEVFDTMTGEPLTTATAQASDGTLVMTAPPFVRDIAIKLSPAASR